MKSQKITGFDKEKEVRFSFPDPGKVTETALLQFKNVNFGYTPEKIIFKDLDFGIYIDSRIGLVGPNGKQKKFFLIFLIFYLYFFFKFFLIGVGKSTIMNLMLKELKPLDGQVVANTHLRLAHFSQHHVDQLDMEKTPVEHLQNIDGDQSISEVRRHLGKKKLLFFISIFFYFFLFFHFFFIFFIFLFLFILQDHLELLETLHSKKSRVCQEVKRVESLSLVLHLNILISCY